MEAVGVLDASAAVDARVEGAVADFVAAVGSGESVGAGAVERVDAVDASAAVGAGLVLAVVGAGLAMLSLESFLADARERLARVEARRSVVARVLVASEIITCSPPHTQISINSIQSINYTFLSLITHF